MVYQLSVYEKAMPDSLTLEEKLLASIEMGYDSCEICIDMDESRQQRLDWPDQKFEQFNHFLSENQLRIYSVSLSALRGSPLGSLDPELISLAFERIEKGLKFAQRIGAGVMLVNAYDVYDEESTLATQQQFAHTIQRVAELAAKYQVIVGLENAEMAFGDTLEKVVKWVQMVDSPWLQAYFDPANSYNALDGSTERVQADFQVGAEYVKAVHLKDSRPGDYRMTPYGEGQVEFDAMIPLLVENHQQCYTAELFMQDETQWFQYGQWVNRYLRRFIDQAYETIEGEN